MTYNSSDFDFSAFINSPLANEGLLPNDTGDGIAEQASAMMAASLMDTRSNTVDALFGDTSGASQTHDADVNNYGANFGQDASHSTVGNHANGAHIDGHVEQQQQQQQVYTGWDGYDQTQMSAPPQAPSYANDGATVPQPQAEGSTLPSVPEAQLNSRAMAYSARVAAHHSEKLRAVMPAMANHRGPTGGSIGGLPASLGLPGQRSHGGSISSSTVPMSHTAQRALAASKPILTLQERRRNSRRAQAQINKSAAARSQRSAAQVRSPTSADSGVNNSGRHAKRGMTTSSGHIHSPASTDASRQQDVRASASQQQNTHSAMTGIEQQLDEKPVVNEEQQIEVHGHEQAQGPSALAKRGSTDRARPVPVSRQVYSSSGFDMIGALARVVLRPNPRIALGPVDMSCSFTVCDARHPEQPIVYCSDTFCKLTGYSRQEIIGRNCRFLQSPDGRVEPGAERFHTDNAAVAHLKQHSRALQECQASLINYRKNGTPFINLVTVIPIAWDAGDDPAYLVGFQVDLVEQPSAVLERAVDGSYVVNYSTTEDFHSRVAPAEQPAPPPRDYEQEAAQREVGVGKDILDIVSGGKDDANRWARIMLQHSQDLIHVLSLKGTFLYVSPSIERLLGWKPEELIGKSISEFCHPSDVVPVFRELKDSTSNASINAAAKRSFRSEGVSNRATKGGVGQGGPEVGLLMRMKHKDGSFAWVESKGKLHLEQGKGRKVVISSGRTRPVYNLPWAPVKETVGGMEPSFWAKVSSDGLVLSASEGVSSVIDGADSSALYGKHLQQMVNNGAMPALLECLRGVQVMTVTHKMWNIVDEPVWVTSTLFPSAVIPGTHVVPAVFMKVSLAERESKSKKNIAETKAFAGKSGYDDEQPEEGSVPSSSVFGELSTQRSSSHIYELHSLKHANRRLKEEVRAAQRRLGNKTGVNEWDQHHGALHPSRPTAPLKEDFVEALNQKSKGHGSHLLAPPMRSSSSSTPSGSNGHSSGEQSSLFEAGISGGSGSDETVPTTATPSGNASDSSGSDGKKGF